MGCSLAKAVLKEWRRGQGSGGRGWEKVTLPAAPAGNWLSGTSLGHRGQLGQEAVYNDVLSGALCVVVGPV